MRSLQAKEYTVRMKDREKMTEEKNIVEQFKRELEQAQEEDKRKKEKLLGEMNKIL